MMQIDTRLIEAARQIGPILAEHSKQAESERRLAKPVVDALRNARFTEPLGLAEIASSVDVHPAHLAQVFRAFHRCTVGEHVRRRRLELAARELVETDRTLAAIACHAGFCDQSHLTRAFRAWTGTTPAAFRARSRGRKGHSRALV